MNVEILKQLKCELYHKILKQNGDGVITFFTPTYNRSKFILRIFECLKNQTDKHFVWILVNDGAVDETDEVALELLRSNEIPMLYIKKENGGKHSAFKVALDACETEYFQCMDDDDVYDERAVEVFLDNWRKVGERNDIGAIRTLSRLPNGGYAISFPITDRDLGTYEDATTLEMNYVRHRYQENWTCYRTASLRSVDLFPAGYWLAEQHKFFLESIWQGRFARKYKCRYLNVALREYRDDAEVSLIRAKKSRQHYLDMFINTKMVLDEQLDYVKRSPKGLLKMILIVNLLRNYLGVSLSDLIRHTHSMLLRLLYFVSWPMSLSGKMVINKRK